METSKPLSLALRPLDDTDVTTWELPEGAIARLGQGGLRDVGFSPDGSFLAVATEIGFWLYDTTTMAPRALWGAERGMSNVVTFSNDMQWIASGDQDGMVKVWDTQDGQCVTKIDYGSTHRFDDVFHVYFSSDGQHLAASGFGHSAVYAWRTDRETPIVSFTVEDLKFDDYAKKFDPNHDRNFPIAFSPDSNLFAFVSSPHTVTISDINTGKAIAELTGHTAPLHSLLFSLCGQYLAGANLGATVQIWDIQGKSFVMEPTTYEGNRVRLAYTADGTLRVADVHRNKVVIWDASKGKKSDVFETEGYTDRASRFSNDGTQFAVCSTCGNVQVWKEGTPSTAALFSGFKSTAESVVFLQDGSTLISNHWGTTGKVFWDVASRETQRIFPPLTERTSFFKKGMALSACGELLAVDTSDANIEVWHIPSETLVSELTEHEKHGHGITLAFSPTREYLVSGGWADESYVWDVALWEKRHSLIEQTDSVVDIAFHPDGKLFVTTSRDGTVRLWNVETGEQITPLLLPDILEDATGYRGEPEEIERVINGGNLQWKRHQHIQSIVFSPCGTLIAGGLGTWLADGLTNEIRLWDTATLETRMIILPSQGTIRPWALTFSPCGRYLISGAWWCPGLDKAPIRIWEVATGEHIHTFWAHSTDVQDVAFSPDGTLLASGSFDGTILLWDMKPFIGS
ncbi:MAG: WD40 repeat domain-containing protein [Candidatus Poribacteria bacterium]|nr:WD40 repeat domain-containing protein [Candidatus Poribacteria bacterium]